MRNRQDFAVAKTNEPVAQSRFRFVMRKARGPLPRRRKPWRKSIEAVDARDFFDQIDFALHFGTPGRLSAFPGRENRAFRAAVLINPNGSKAEGAEARFDLLVGNVRAHHA